MNTSKKLCFKGLGLGLIGGIFTALVLILLCALFLSLCMLPVGAIPVLTSIALALGGLAAGMVTAYFIGEKGLVFGTISGLLLFLLFFVVSLLGLRTAPTFATLIKGVIDIIAGGIGGIIGVNLKGKNGGFR